MKINQNYKLREVAGETIVVNQGTAGMDMTHILTTTYGIGHEQAMKDAQVWVDALMKCKIIE